MRLGINTRGLERGFFAGCSSALAVVLLLLLLLQLTQARPVPRQSACAPATPEDPSQPVYNENPPKDTSVGFMSALVQSFLHIVQPNSFPRDLILQVVQQYDSFWSNQDIINKVLIYEVGFLVCIAIGVLYVVLMPIVGLCLACCRCHGKCGGKMYQKQTSSTNSRRRIFYWSMVATTIILLAGNICMFKSNENLRTSVTNSPAEFRDTVNNVNTFFATVSQQIDFVVNASGTVVDDVTENFNGVGRRIGTEIQNRFRGRVNALLTSVRLLDEETDLISSILTTTESLRQEIQSSMDSLQAKVNAVSQRVVQTASNPNCVDCDIVEDYLETIEMEPSITIIGFSEFQSAIQQVFNIDLDFRAVEVEELFRMIPEMTTVDTKDVVQRSIQILGDIRTQISGLRGDIPLSSITRNVSQYMEMAHTEINKVMPQAQRAEKIRWAVCVVLCSVVLLVVVCYIAGLVLGPAGLRSDADPTKRSSASACGGTFLMMGAGFSFLFAWLFMIAVLILFLLGGNVYTLLCKPWNNGELLEFLDTPQLIPGLDLSQNLELETNLTLSGIYRDCEKNNSLWTTLHLHELINLEERLDVSKYTEDIRKEFEITKISVSSLDLINQQIQILLDSVATRADNFDSTPVVGVNIVCDKSGVCSEYSHFLPSENPDISSDALFTTATVLEQLAFAQADVGIKAELEAHAKDLLAIEEEIMLIINPLQENLNRSVINLASSQKRFIEQVDEVLEAVRMADNFLITTTPQIVKNESIKFLDCQLNYFTGHANWTINTLTQQVGRCGPLAGAVDSVETVLCSNIVESLNAFWFSLGWCIAFFLPGIIFSIKLAKYYRRMKNSDVEVMLQHWEINPNHNPNPLVQWRPVRAITNQTYGDGERTRKRRQKRIPQTRRRRRQQQSRRRHQANPNFLPVVPYWRGSPLARVLHSVR